MHVKYPSAGKHGIGLEGTNKPEFRATNHLKLRSYRPFAMNGLDDGMNVGSQISIVSICNRDRSNPNKSYNCRFPGLCPLTGLYLTTDTIYKCVINDENNTDKSI